MTVTERLLNLRANKNLSQKETAKLFTCVGYGTYRSIELGKRVKEVTMKKFLIELEKLESEV